MTVLIVYGGLALFLLLLAVIFYTLSVQSRRRYVCPACGERVHTEHLEASHCSTCGAPLNRDYHD